MSGRHGHQRKKKKTERPSASQVVIEEAPCQEHPDNRKEDQVTDTNSNPKSLLRDKIFDTAAAAVFISIPGSRSV
jgi:hypothetical protein